VRGVRRGNLDELTVRDAPVDILCQQMVAACAAEELGEDELFALVTGAAPYAALPRARFDELLAMLAEGMSSGGGSGSSCTAIAWAAGSRPGAARGSWPSPRAAPSPTTPTTR
jgi:ATP-dependent Lhr-like helicase